MPQRPQPRKSTRIDAPPGSINGAEFTWKCSPPVALADWWFRCARLRRLPLCCSCTSQSAQASGTPSPHVGSADVTMLPDPPVLHQWFEHDSATRPKGHPDTAIGTWPPWTHPARILTDSRVTCIMWLALLESSRQRGRSYENPVRASGRDSQSRVLIPYVMARILSLERVRIWQVRAQ